MKVNGMLLKKYYNFFDKEEQLYMTFDSDNMTICNKSILFFIPIAKEENEVIENKAYKVVDNKDLEILLSIKSKRADVEFKANQKTLNLTIVKANETLDAKVKVEEIPYQKPKPKTGIKLDQTLFLPYIQISNLTKENENIEDMGKIRFCANASGIRFDTLDLFENVSYDEVKLEETLTKEKFRKQFNAKDLTKPLVDIAKIVELNNLLLWYNDKGMKISTEDFMVRVKFEDDDLSFIFKNFKEEDLKEIDSIPEGYINETSDQISYKTRKANFLLTPIKFMSRERFMVFQRNIDNKTFQYVVAKKRQ